MIRAAFAGAIHVLADATARRLRRLGPGLETQRATLAHLLARFARTRFGAAHGLRAGQSYADFQRALPPRPYEGFHDWVEQMKKGQADVLWPGRCLHYAVSSGTTAGRTKYIPVTPDMLGHFRRTGLDSLTFYVNRVGHARVFRGRHLFLGGATELTPLGPGYPQDAFAGDLSGITALNMPGWASRLIYEPGLEIARSGDWPRKIEAIVQRCAERPISLVAGIPTWTLILFEALRQRHLAAGRPFTTIRDVWPHLECFIHGGVPLAPFRAELDRWFGGGVAYHEVFPASEGFIACQDAEPEAGLRLLVDAGIFYEFLPLADFDESRLDQLGAAAVPLEGVRPGIPYVLLLTTPAGLCRYVIGDVVQFISTHPPRLVYAGRTKLQLSAFGEHVIEKELTDAIMTVSRAEGWEVASFHVAPVIEDLPDGRRRGRHQWWIEVRASAAGRPTALAERSVEVARALDSDLARRNEDYEAKRAGGGLTEPEVRWVPPGTFDRWMQQAGKWGGQNKMPRCRSDRLVADALSRLAAGEGTEPPTGP